MTTSGLAKVSGRRKRRPYGRGEACPTQGCTPARGMTHTRVVTAACGRALATSTIPGQWDRPFAPGDTRSVGWPDVRRGATST